MARTIILVRHGKAKKAQLGTDDIDRPLVPGAAEALAPPSATRWPSSTARARRTCG